MGKPLHRKAGGQSTLGLSNISLLLGVPRGNDMHETAVHPIQIS